jgi:cob(I)alamin adenosyltransferase
MKNERKIYTKNGDKGYTQLLSGEKVPKYDKRVEAYGSLDEACSFIGYFYEMIEYPDIRDDLFEIINNIFILEAHVANKSKSLDSLPAFTGDKITFLENRIDQYSNELSELSNFILPIGDPTMSFCHIIRTIVRRAERKICEFAEEDSTNNYDLVLSYLNRLSDYFFVLSRKILLLKGKSEIFWKH